MGECKPEPGGRSRSSAWLGVSARISLKSINNVYYKTLGKTCNKRPEYQLGVGFGAIAVRFEQYEETILRFRVDSGVGNEFWK